MSHIESLRIDCAESQLMSTLRHYSSMSARIPFGQGGVAHAERLYAMLPDTNQLELAHTPELYSMAGWMALELAAYNQPDSRHRRDLAIKAEQLFERAARFKDSDNGFERLESIRGRMGLIATNAYLHGPRAAIEDSPGMYAAILEDVLEDSGMQMADNGHRIGSMAELTVGMVLGSLDLLTLPASLRHDRVISIEKPSYSQDMSTWILEPDNLPAKPDRMLQIKTRNNGHKEYSAAISLVETNTVFKKGLYAVATAFIRHYNGVPTSRNTTKIMKSAQLSMVKALMQNPGEDNYQLRGARMRNRTTGRTLVVPPRKPVD